MLRVVLCIALLFSLFSPVKAQQSTTWQDVAVTIDGDSIDLYVNGVLSQTINLPGVTPTSFQLLSLGQASNTAKNFYGYVKSLDVYSQMMAPATLAALSVNDTSACPQRAAAAQPAASRTTASALASGNYSISTHAAAAAASASSATRAAATQPSAALTATAARAAAAEPCAATAPAAEPKPTAASAAHKHH